MLAAAGILFVELIGPAPGFVSRLFRVAAVDGDPLTYHLPLLARAARGQESDGRVLDRVR